MQNIDKNFITKPEAEAMINASVDDFARLVNKGFNDQAELFNCELMKLRAEIVQGNEKIIKALGEIKKQKN